MSTRSVIAIRNTAKDFDIIYCHWDGHPKHNGVMLKTHFNTLEKARELIACGNMSCLGAGLEDSSSYKDRGDNWDDVKPGKVDSYRAVKDYCDWAEFMYIWVADNADKPAAGSGSWTCTAIAGGLEVSVLLDNL